MKQKEALEILKMGHNVYLTGPAGSGKTHLLNDYIDFLKKNKVGIGVTASTGIAATHMGGSTIHSWAGIGIKDDLNEWELDSLLQKRYLAKRFQETKVLIIDEVSMLHYFRLDLIDKVCRAFKQNDVPFGGIQVILSGDFFQLPPINKGSNEFSFINKADVWGKMNLKICYLEEQFRQECNTLENILNDIRKNDVGENVLEPLRTCYKRNIENYATPTKLYTHNIDIDRINNSELDKIEGLPRVFEMSTKGKKALVDTFKKSCLAPDELRLKKGAVVMFLKNNLIKKYVNGTLGTVVDFSDRGLPIIKTYDGRRIEADRESWTIDDEGIIKAELKQIPLRLAWAITVHKSQGMSLDAAEIDLSKSFIEGMGYVALSRVRSLKGLRLMGLNDIALQVNKEILDLDAELLDLSKEIVGELKGFSKLELKKQQKQFIENIKGTKIEPEEKISTYEQTKKLIEEKKSLIKIAIERKLTQDTIVGHIERLKEDGEKLDLSHLKVGIPKARLEKIKKAFKESGGTKLIPVKEILGDKFEYDEIKLGRLFI